jgi:hypothetical protein
MEFRLIRANPRRSAATKNKINAAQASHPSRIACECDAGRFHRIKRRIVNSDNRIPEGTLVD